MAYYYPTFLFQYFFCDMDATAMSSSSSSSSSATSTFHLLIDSNEQAHYAKKGIDLCSVLSARSALPAQVKSLECGDYALVYATSTAHAASDDAPCYALFERKTHADLASSIQDLRYKSQAQRLVDSTAPYVYWIITPATLFDPRARVAINSAMLHLMTSYPRTRVYQLADGAPELFAETLRTVADYIGDTEFNEGRGTQPPSMRTVQTRGAKPRFETQQEVWLEQLCVPRGMSVRKARAVAAVAPNVEALLELWRAAKASAPVPQLNGSSSAFDKLTGSSSSKRGKKRQKTPDELADEALAHVVVEEGSSKRGPTRLGEALSKRLRQTIAPSTTLVTNAK